MIAWCLRCVQTEQIAVSFTHKCTQNNIQKPTDTHEVCRLHEDRVEYLLSYIFTNYEGRTESHELQFFVK